MPRGLDALERMANEKTREFDRLYLKTPEHKRKIAYRVFLDVAEGRITYEEALRKLRELARH